MSEPVSHICARCRRPLNYRGHRPTGQWIHTPFDQARDPSPHDPEPIPAAGQMVFAHCDFCQSDLWPGEQLFLPVKSFSDTVTRGFARSIEDWCACTTCASLINNNQWSALAKRATQAYCNNHGITDRREKRAMEDYIRKLYRQVRANITGPVREAEGGTVPSPQSQEGENP